MKKLLYITIVVLLAGCDFRGARDMDYDAFGTYWYQGKAEISTYTLEQYRYGEKREGEAVLVFVTEDFSKKKQVKLDDPQANEDDAQKVLKLNLTKKFVTGIYPYSMMLSVFTPVYNIFPAVKVTASVQEWCGQTFTQLNRKGGKYVVRLFSYFEQEGDQEISIDAVPEDNLWTLLRLHPNEVPTGEVMLIPGLLDQRLTHEQLEAEEAEINIIPATQGMAGVKAADLQVLEVKYTSYPRTLRIFYTSAFPFEITGWEEERAGKEGQQEVSRATRKAKLMTDYWTKNKKMHEPLRRQLKLD